MSVLLTGRRVGEVGTPPSEPNPLPAEVRGDGTCTRLLLGRDVAAPAAVGGDVLGGADGLAPRTGSPWGGCRRRAAACRCRAAPGCRRRSGRRPRPAAPTPRWRWRGPCPPPRAPGPDAPAGRRAARRARRTARCRPRAGRVPPAARSSWFSAMPDRCAPTTASSQRAGRRRRRQAAAAAAADARWRRSSSADAAWKTRPRLASAASRPRGPISVMPAARPSLRNGPGTAMAARSSRLTKLV